MHLFTGKPLHPRILQWCFHGWFTHTSKNHLLMQISTRWSGNGSVTSGVGSALHDLLPTTLGYLMDSTLWAERQLNLAQN